MIKAIIHLENVAHISFSWNMFYVVLFEILLVEESVYPGKIRNAPSRTFLVPRIELGHWCETVSRQ